MIHRRPEASWNNADAVNPGSVIPFVRPRGDALPLSGIGAAERPAPDVLAAFRRPPWRVIFFSASLLAHAGVAAFFLRPSDPAPAIGLEAISVEVVFGADAPAGVAAVPGEQEAQPQPPSPPEAPVAKQEPVEPEPAVDPAPAIPPSDANVAQAANEKESRKEEVAPPSRAAGGVGRGQSRSDANYNGLVAAHLARHKRFPPGPQSKRNQGTAVVSFRLDGSGRLTAVKLVRSSGVAALDQEAQVMVRRASPFPVPPRGPASFTVPLTFQIQ